MVFSRYNILYCSNGSYKLYNSRTNFYANISKELFDTLSMIKVTENFSLESLNIPQDLLKKLLDSKVIVNPYDDDDFYNLKKKLRYNHAFSKSSLGLIIVPTLACNFKCPYCYEAKLSHKTMNTSTMEQIIKFVENSGCKTVNLCWHGGKPLLAFEKMHFLLNRLYNISKLKITTHSMVTNGFLLDKKSVIYSRNTKLTIFK